LRREVESLLGQGESFLATPVALPRSSRLGAYELLSVIGAGGTVAATEGKEVELPQGTVLRVRFDAPVQLNR